MEIEIKTGKFWVLETRDEKTNTKYIFDTEKLAIVKMKGLLKTIPADKIIILAIDVSAKDWKINQVPWQTIVTAMVNE